MSTMYSRDDSFSGNLEVTYTSTEAAARMAEAVARVLVHCAGAAILFSRCAGGRTL